MIEEETTLKVPRNTTRYLVVFWALVGLYVARKEARRYYGTLSDPAYRPENELRELFKPESRWRYVWRIV